MDFSATPSAKGRAMTPPLWIVISDSSPLISLSRIEQLHHLGDLFGEITIPQAVYDEVVTFGDERSGSDEVFQSDWISVCSVEDPTNFEYLFDRLDIGEAEAIALASEMDADLILVDESKARKVAQRLGFKVTGTAGILLLLKDEGKVEKVQPLLDKLRTLGFRLDDRVYQQVLSQADEIGTES